MPGDLEKVAKILKYYIKKSDTHKTPNYKPKTHFGLLGLPWGIRFWGNKPWVSVSKFPLDYQPPISDFFADPPLNVRKLLIQFPILQQKRCPARKKAAFAFKLCLLFA